MTSGAAQLQLWQFSLIYLLLIVVSLVMKKSRVNLVRQLFVASLRMSVQLVLAGLVLSYVFKNPHPVFVLLYLSVIIGFSVFRVLRQNKGLGRRFQAVIAASILFSGLAVLAFFILAVVGESPFNPQYVIPIAGMLMGNTMTGVGLGVRAFGTAFRISGPASMRCSTSARRPGISCCPLSGRPWKPPCSPPSPMMGMGIVSLPGMMTGQILSSTLPMTTILYQIAIMIAICAVVCLASFGALHFGYQTLYNERNQILLEDESTP